MKRATGSFLRGGALGSVGVVCLLVSGSAHADRVVLAPQGDTLAPNMFKTEFSISPQKNDQNRAWMQFSTPEGIEFELERTDLLHDDKKRYSFNMEYPLIPDIGRAPSLAVGVRDILGTGYERQSLYAVLAKNVSLSDRQYRVLHNLTLNLGLGTGRLNGPFLGIQARTAFGLDLRAEIFRQRLNLDLGVPLYKSVKVKATSIDGTFYYGVALAWTR